MHVIFIRSYTVGKGKVSVKCALIHCASRDTQPAGLLGAPLLVVGSAQDCSGGYKGLGSAGQLPKHIKWQQVHTLLWDDQMADTVCYPCLSCHKVPLLNVLHRCPEPDSQQTLFSSLLLLSSLFPSTPPPSPPTPELLCLPLPPCKGPAATGSCQGSHFTSLFIPSTFANLFMR